MKAFEYVSPKSLDDALEALRTDDAEALAGGTDLLERMKDYVTSPERVVYIRDLKDLAGIQTGADGLTIGANTRLVELIESDAIGSEYPAIRQAALDVATPQIRNMATLAGNLLQRPRCWYYRSGFGLLGKQDGESLVRKGDNRYHAIFMTDGDALFVSPSNLAVPLIALGAKATIVGKDGERTVAIEDLYRAPRREEDRELTIEPGELLTKVVVPKAKGKNATYGIRYKQAHDWPLVLASVCCDTDGDRVKDARVVLYGVAPIPWRCKAAEDAINGRAINLETAESAGEAGTKGAKPLSKNGYKVPLVKTAIKRALLAAAGNRYWEEEA